MADEVIVHLADLAETAVRLTLEFEARFPDGVPQHIRHVLTENGTSLEFEDIRFESEQPPYPGRGLSMKLLRLG